MSNMNEIKKHFEQEAREFDQTILKLVPFYDEMIDALVSAIPFSETSKISVLDIGCGTGTVASKVKTRFPYSTVTCLDLAENMIEMAKLKMKQHDNIAYILADFSDYKFEKRYDCIVSSLSLHHIVTAKEKKQFYKKLFDSISDGGCFYNADVILGSNNHIEEVNLFKWIEFMKKNLTMDEIENKWLPKYYEEDRPEKLIDHLWWLNDIGFVDVDVIWKYYKGAVYGGIKKSTLPDSPL